MPTREVRFLLCKEGTFREQVDRTEVALNDAIKDALIGDVMLSARNVHVCQPETGMKTLHLRADRHNNHYWTAEVRALKLNCRFSVGKDGVMTPNFQPRGSKDRDPILRLDWLVPGDLHLRFIVAVENGTRAEYFMLTAFDHEKMPYKLPLPNLYDDTQLCLGSGFRAQSDCSFGVFKAARDQFIKSDWNTDLLVEETKAKAAKLFRFTPDGEGFKQLPSMDHWTKLSEKVAPSNRNYIEL